MTDVPGWLWLPGDRRGSGQAKGCWRVRHEAMFDGLAPFVAGLQVVGLQAIGILTRSQVCISPTAGGIALGFWLSFSMPPGHDAWSMARCGRRGGRGDCSGYSDRGQSPAEAGSDLVLMWPCCLGPGRDRVFACGYMIARAFWHLRKVGVSRFRDVESWSA